jgi:sirohydrochlorin cobaltochelatase
MTKRGVILFAHGSRDALWHQPIEAVAARVAQIDPAVLVRCAYLELTPPDLSTSATELVASGAISITVMPMFLGVGKHAREDLPTLIADLRERHPQIVFNLQPALGEQVQLIELLAQIALS